MLNILRTQPTGMATNTFLDATVTIRDGNKNIPDMPDIPFTMRTYEKIARGGDGSQVGDLILLPINLFFQELSLDEHKDIYNMYRYAKDIIDRMTMDTMRDSQDLLQEKIFNLIEGLKLSSKMIEFCKTKRFDYPDLSGVGNAPHHSKEKTFKEEDYIELTAISILAKMMVPIWGEFIRKLNDIGIGNNQREKIAFDLIEPTLEEGVFERIFNKLSYSLSTTILDIRKATDKKTMGGTTTSFILTHNGIDDQMFDAIVMATIVVKRMATYECLSRLKDGNVPNAMVYIDDGIKKTADTRIKTMRNTMSTMPRRPLPTHDQEDNSSILDHASKTSKKPIDVPMFVTTAVEQWELPRLLQDTDTPMDVYNEAVEYYRSNAFDVSPLTQAMVASFIGTRFGGSKCIGYLPPHLYQRIVVILQIFLIKNDMIDLAGLISAKSSSTPIEGLSSPIGVRITATLKQNEYVIRCDSLFKGFLIKPVTQFGKKSVRGVAPDRIDFNNHIKRMVEWLIRYTHGENMAPSLWDFAKVEVKPIVGSACKFDEFIIRDLCRFYLLFHDDKRPF